MTKERILAILDECIDQEKLVKLLAAEAVVPFLEGAKAKVESGEIDPIKSTSLDNKLLGEALDLLIAKAKAG